MGGAGQAVVRHQTPRLQGSSGKTAIPGPSLPLAPCTAAPTCFSSGEMASSARTPLGWIRKWAPRGRSSDRSITATRVPGLQEGWHAGQAADGEVGSGAAATSHAEAGRRLSGGGQPLQMLRATCLPASCLACKTAWAVARPAGPPPAIKTSTLIVWLCAVLVYRRALLHCLQTNRVVWIAAWPCANLG